MDRSRLPADRPVDTKSGVLERGVDPLYTARRPQIGRICRKTRIACNPEPSAIASLTRFGSAAWGVPKLNVAGSSPVTRFRINPALIAVPQTYRPPTERLENSTTPVMTGSGASHAVRYRYTTARSDYRLHKPSGRYATQPRHRSSTCRPHKRFARPARGGAGGRCGEACGRRPCIEGCTLMPPRERHPVTGTETHRQERESGGSV